MNRLQYIIDIAADPQSPNALDTIGTLARELQALEFKRTAADGPLPMTRAEHDVLAERRRHVDVEGWTPEHDDELVNDEIAALACFYAMPQGAREWPANETGYGSTLGEAIVPNGWVAKASGRRQQLVKAGSLVLAEIDRLDRSEAGPSAGRGGTANV